MSNLSQLLQMSALLDAQVHRLGRAESERRLGCPIDAAFLHSLHTPGADGNIATTAAYADAMAKLSAE